MPSLKLTWQRQADALDLTVTADLDTPIGEIAGAILRRNPEHPLLRTAPATLGVPSGGSWLALDSRRTLRDSGLGNGSRVSVMPASQHYLDPTIDQKRIELTIVEGVPGDVGSPAITLGAGQHTLGRDPQGRVVVRDPRVSALHARIEVSSDLVIYDTNSTNGTFVNGGRVSRAQLRSGDRIGLGDDTILEVKVLGGLSVRGGADTSRGEVLFNRSPRLDPHYPGIEKEAPAPPRRPHSRRFPIIPMLAPLAMGAVLFAFTHAIYSLIFVAMSPILVVGTYAEDTISNRRDFKRATREFREELALLDGELTDEAKVEVTRRRAEHPSAEELVSAAGRLDPLLWIRRPEHETFLDLRLGLGRQPSRTTVKLPQTTETSAQLRAELTDLVKKFADIDGVPVVARLTECGALGVSEFPGADGARAATAVVAQLASLHSPAELILAAVVTLAESQGAWRWLKWLPHTSPHLLSPHTPLIANHLTTGGAATAALLSELDDVIDQRSAGATGGGDVLPQPAIVLLVTDEAAPDERAHMVSIAERGRGVGVFVIWVAARVENLPAVCRTYLTLTTAGAAVGYVERPELLQPVSTEALTPAQAEAFARGLAPVVDSGAHVEDDSSLPQAVSFLDLADAALATDAAAVREKWVEAEPVAGRKRTPSLRALVGSRGSGESFELDLVEQGPHALVGGTTGAGKSEFLQSWILGMATRYSPQRVTFLLVDYKGGSAFGPCSQLPHAVGLVTDLTPHLISRVLRSLKAELKRREELLEGNSAKDLPTLEQKHPEIAPPRLVIVVDEFAALKKDAPEFVDEMVDIAQRGRSLGLHLILATQRPTGVITDNLKANTNLRVALRLTDTQDSQDVIGANTAALFAPGIPGRAVAKTGPGRLVTFQAAYAGGRTTSEPPPPPIAIRSLPFSPDQEWEEPEDRAAPVPADPGSTDVVRIVERAGEAFGHAPRPRRPWLDALRPPLALERVLDRAEAELAEEATRLGKQPPRSPIVYGRRDLPEAQAQPPAFFDPDSSANLAILGTGGSGKTTVLRTLAIASLFGGAGPCHIYGIDFGTRGLDLIEPLPHVARIVQGQDADRVANLFGLIRRIIAERNQEFARVGANSIASYWDLQRLYGDARWDKPRVLLFIDGMAAFAQQYQAGVAPQFEALQRIASDGRKCGVHVVVTGDSGGAVPSGLMSAMQGRIVLRLASNDEYALLGVPGGILDITSPAGAGVVVKDEVQVATFGGDIDEAELRDRVVALAARYADVPGPQSIDTWSDPIALTDLARAARVDAPVIGRGPDLQPARMPSRGYFLVTGATAPDRAVALSVVAESLRTWRAAIRLTYLGPTAPPASVTLDWGTPVVGAEAVRASLSALRQQVTATPGVLVVAGAPELFDAGLTEELTTLLTAATTAGGLVVVEGDATQLQDLRFQFARSSKAGFALRPQMEHGQLFGTFFQVNTRETWPAGRGYLVDPDAERPRPVQLAVPG